MNLVMSFIIPETPDFPLLIFLKKYSINYVKYKNTKITGIYKCIHTGLLIVKISIFHIVRKSISEYRCIIYNVFVFKYFWILYFSKIDNPKDI